MMRSPAMAGRRPPAAPLFTLCFYSIRHPRIGHQQRHELFPLLGS